MERLLVVVFDSEKRAYEASRALNELDLENSISVFAESVIEKKSDGTVQVKKTDGDFPVRSLAGTAIGSLIGLLGGPVGVILGATTGWSAGLVGDFYVAGVNTDFLADASARLAPGKFALLADISEEWTTPVDTRMEALGGTVIRTGREHFEAELWARELAAMKEDIKHLDAELAHAHAERKAKIQAKINDLNTKLHEKQEQAKQRLEQIKKENEAKLRTLQERAAKSRGETKTALNKRIAELKKQDEEASLKLKHAMAEALRKAAAKIERAS